MTLNEIFIFCDRLVTLQIWNILILLHEATATRSENCSLLNSKFYSFLQVKWFLLLGILQVLLINSLLSLINLNFTLIIDKLQYCVSFSNFCLFFTLTILFFLHWSETPSKSSKSLFRKLNLRVLRRLHYFN